MLKDLNIILKTIDLLEEQRKELLDIDLVEDFLSKIAKVQETKAKQTNKRASKQKLLHGKASNQWNKQRSYRLEENICKLYILQGVSNQNIYGTQQQLNK